MPEMLHPAPKLSVTRIPDLCSRHQQQTPVKVVLSFRSHSLTRSLNLQQAELEFPRERESLGPSAADMNIF